MIARARLLPLLAVPALLGCGAGTRAETPAPRAEPAVGAVAAELNGAPISVAEVEAQLDPEGRQTLYDLRRAALDKLLEQRLLEAEAKARGTSVEQILEREVDAKAAPPDKREAEAVYAQNLPRIANLPKQQVMADIERQQLARNRAQRRLEFRRELMKKAGVRLLLEPPRVKLEIPAGAPALGPESAPVTIVEFADYQCPFCYRAQQTVEKVLEKYRDKVRFVHLDYPLDSIHPRAVAAAVAARCAGEQGRFWEYHRNLLAAPPHSGSFPDEDLKKRAAELGLDAGKFASCLARPGGDAPVRAGYVLGNELGVGSTPTFFINGRQLLGAKPLEEFVEVIDEELDRVG
jgi:protein-disulfide isomerase